MASPIASPVRGRSRFTKTLPTAPNPDESSDMEKLMMAKQLPSLPERKSSRTMNIPRRAVGSPASVTKKPSMASLNSSIYTDMTRSRSESESSNYTKDSLSYAGSEFRKTPPLPEKDEQRDMRPVTPGKDSASPKSISSLKSSPGQEIWRRRELLGKKGIEFPDLKLLKSNGSTASPPSQNVLPQPNRSLPGLPSHPRPQKGLLSGRHGGPIPAREAPQPPIPQMGGKVSKLKSAGKRKVSAADQIDGAGGNGSKNEHRDSLNSPKDAPPEQISSSFPPNDSTLPPAHQRQPSTPQVLPLATPPYDSLHSIPQIPSRATARNHPPESSTESPLIPNILHNTHSRSPSETLTITSLNSVIRSPKPHKPIPANSSLLTPEPSPPPSTHEMRSVSNSASTTTTDSITTSTRLSHSRHPSSRTTTTQSYSHAYFPAPFSPSTLPDKHTLLKAPSLTREHVECFAGHKYMRRSRNDLCPVECMVCRKGDVGVEGSGGGSSSVSGRAAGNLEAFLKSVGRELEGEDARSRRGGEADAAAGSGSGGMRNEEMKSERESGSSGGNENEIKREDEV
ncbi:hypothetical protein ACMFMG_010950 [Clarireedia jacksonii]